ncbi:TonB-dependent receptor domain-containing protein [Silvibacterium acidisoli]|uniref:TonB-dependent receptor domain-containing protein n=1 Tax=Acidobacteriaceae bacterium ZG23-2 TaxID=2883246 RepID=UPI00406CF99A
MRDFQMKVKWCLFFWLAAAVFVAPAFSQVNGAISGRVFDSSEAALPGAEVVATNSSTNAAQKVVSDQSGQYSFLALPPGPYTLTVTASGFKTFTATGIDLKVNDQLQIDARLTLGNVQQSVSVQADAVQVETENTQLGGVVESKQMLAMPLNGRSYLDLLGLQAGVVPVTSGTVPSDRTVSGQIGNPGNVSVNGQPETGNSFMVNGADVNESKNMGAGLIPNLDSIAEFRLITNSFSAEYGKFSGAIMNAITKSGTNSIHGDAFEFLRNDAFDARNYFDPSKAELHRNQFGYAVGGPFWRNRLFWFSDYQGTRQVQGSSTGQVNLPTDAQRAGNFGPGAFVDGSGNPTVVQGAYWAQLLSSRLGKTVTAGEAYNDIFPNGVIPQAAFDKVSTNVEPYIPNLPAGQPVYSYNSGKNTITDDKIGERVDLDTKSAGTLSFYYHFDNTTVDSALGGNNLPGFATASPSRAQMFTAGDVKTIGPTMVNESRISFFRTYVQTANPTSGFASLSSLGFTTGVGTNGINPSGPAGYQEVVPEIATNEFSLGNTFLNLKQVNNTFGIWDNFTKIVNNHTLKFGADGRYYQVIVRNICAPFGNFTFNGSETGSDFADFLLGAPNYYVQCTEQLQDNRSRYGGFFAQDSWKAKPNLVLNLGVRWDISMPWYDTQGKTETIVQGEQSQVFPLSPLGYVVPGDPGVPSTVSPTGFHNFAPRLGLAWQPGGGDNFFGKMLGGPGKTSIRAAYGLYYVGAADLGNFGIIGDAPFGIYWQSTSPSLFDTPFQTRATGASQGNPFPFTFPVPGSPANKSLSFDKFYPLYSPGYNVKNAITYAEHYHLTIQRELSKSMVATIGYVGTEAHRLEVNLQPNLGDAALCQSLSQPQDVAPGTQQCGPYSEPSVYTRADNSTVYGTLVGLGNQQLGETTSHGKVTFDPTPIVSNLGNSNYNALQLTLERRANNFSFLAAYTYSKSIDNVFNSLNPFHPAQSRALSAFDMRNNFVISYSYNIPFDQAFGSVSKRATTGWSISGITRATSGLPVALTENDDAGLTYYPALDFPVQTGAVKKMDPHKNGGFFFNGNDSFRPENLGEHSATPVRFFSGPGIETTDLGLSKSIPIHDNVSLMIRGEFFNIFNHTNFINPVGNITNSGQFGQVISSRDPRIGQVAAKITF